MRLLTLIGEIAQNIICKQKCNCDRRRRCCDMARRCVGASSPAFRPYNGLCRRQSTPRSRHCRPWPSQDRALSRPHPSQDRTPLNPLQSLFFIRFQLDMFGGVSPFLAFAVGVVVTPLYIQLLRWSKAPDEIPVGQTSSDALNIPGAFPTPPPPAPALHPPAPPFPPLPSLQLALMADTQLLQVSLHHVCYHRLV